MKVKYLATAILIGIFLVASIGMIDAARRRRVRRGWEKKGKVVWLNPDHVGFFYEDRSIRWLTDYADPGWTRLIVDLDGNHSTGACSGTAGWHVDYGEVRSVGAVFLPEADYGSWIFNWAFRIGELKIDDPYEWHTRAVYYPGRWPVPTGEWFCYTLTETEAPTNWEVVLHASNGTHALPIYNFWYSLDGGATWQSGPPP